MTLAIWSTHSSREMIRHALILMVAIYTVAAILYFIMLGILFPKVAFSQPCEQAQPVQQGQVAVCDGVLWPPGWTSEALKCLEVGLPACKTDLERSERFYAICEDTSSQALDSCAKTISMLDARLKEVILLSDPPSWYESPFFWGVTGVLIGLGGGYVLLSP